MTELSLDDLRTGDEVRIATRSNHYHIRITDGEARIARLSSGTRPTPRVVMLVGNPPSGHGGPARLVAGHPLVYTYPDRPGSPRGREARTSPIVSIHWTTDETGHCDAA